MRPGTNWSTDRYRSAAQGLDTTALHHCLRVIKLFNFLNILMNCPFKNIWSVLTDAFAVYIIYISRFTTFCVIIFFIMRKSGFFRPSHGTRLTKRVSRDFKSTEQPARQSHRGSTLFTHWNHHSPSLNFYLLCFGIFYRRADWRDRRWKWISVWSVSLCLSFWLIFCADVKTPFLSSWPDLQ